MPIENKDWYAQMDYMPGGIGFYVYGTVLVSDSGVEPTLVIRNILDKCSTLVLELQLRNETRHATLPVMTEKAVKLVMPGDHGHISKVDIFQGDELLTSITKISETH